MLNRCAVGRDGAPQPSPWSADCGGVPETIVIVPPLCPELVPELLDFELLELLELLELPQAASTTAARTANSAVRACLIPFLLLVVVSRPRNLIQIGSARQVAPGSLINLQHTGS